MNYQNQMLAVLTSRAALARSAWDRGVAKYAVELLRSVCATCYEFESLSDEDFRRLALAGADDWLYFSRGGKSLICDGDIACRLCNATELKRCKNGELQPNLRETWLDVQARALKQAFRYLVRVRSACLLCWRHLYISKSGEFVIPGAGSQKIKRCIACYEREMTPTERIKAELR